MDRSTRNLSIITFVVLAIFLALNHVSRRSGLMDWGAVLLFLLLALGVWFYDRVNRRGVDDAEASDTVIEPLVYDHANAPIGIPDAIELVTPNPGTVIHTTHPAPQVIESAPPVRADVDNANPAPQAATPVQAEPTMVATPTPDTTAEDKTETPPPAPAVEQHPPATAATTTTIEEKAAPPRSAAAPELELSSPVSARPVVEVPTPAKEAKPAQRASKTKTAAAPAKADDLKVIEGIGPKMEKALNAAGITTFAQLAASTEEQINAAIVAAGMRFAPSVPTWAEQASYAAKGDFAGLEAFQKTLVGGRKAK